MSVSFCKIDDWSIVDPSQHINIDLTKLVVCPFFVAYKLGQKLEILNSEQYIQDLFKEVVFNDLKNITNIWYGLESIGNTNVIKAKKIAAKINQKVKINILVDSYITQENLAFIWYLHQYSQSEITFYYQQEIFEKHYLPLFQQLEYNQLEDFDNRKIPYFGEHTIRDLKSLYQAIIESSYFSFLNYQTHEFSYKFILDFIGKILRTGATDLAVYLFKILTQCEKNPSNQAKLLIICLVQQLGLQQYPEIVEETLPKFINSSTDLTSLYFIKGYASLLLNDVQTSANFLTLAGIDEHLKVQDYQDLYKLNILALLKFKQGHPQEALAIQKRIKDYQYAPELYQTNIYYTNELNLGRLARYFGEYELALEHFQSAFKQLEGIKQLVDYIYYCLLVGQLFESQQSWQQTLFYWTLAALIWSALPCKNAMNWRVLLSLLMKNYTLEKPITSEMISEVFINKLQRLMQLLSIKTFAPEQKITIRVLESDQIPVEGAYVYSDFLSFIVSHQPSPVVDLFETSQSFQKLNNLLVIIIKTQIKHLDLGKYQTLYLDLDNGVNIPKSVNNTLVRSWQLNLKLICLDQPINFDEYSQKIEEKIIVNIHPAVREFQEVNGNYYAWFKRYFSPYQLSEYQQQIIKRLLDSSCPPNPSYHSLKQQFPDLSNQLLFSLQADHLIYITS